LVKSKISASCTNRILEPGKPKNYVPGPTPNYNKNVYQTQALKSGRVAYCMPWLRFNNQSIICHLQENLEAHAGGRRVDPAAL